MATQLPYTGQEFLDSLDDGREVWIYGERVKKITAHAAFRNTARLIARLYDAAFLATLGANAEFYEPYQENARRWYRFSQERVPFVNHAIVQPPVDRNMAPGAPGGPTDVYAHVTKETDAGIHVTGAKVVATGSALTHFTFVAHAGVLPVQDKS